MVSLIDLISAATNGMVSDLPPPESAKAIRKAAGISTTDMGAAVGVSSKSIEYWEAGSFSPRTALVRNRYARVLNFLAA